MTKAELYKKACMLPLLPGLALAASNIARTERMQKGRHNIG